MKFTTSKKAKKIYDEFKLALNSDLFKVLMETYPKESITKVWNRIFEVSEASTRLEHKVKEAQENIKNLPIENRDVFEKLNIQ
jgi:hypothetical protein